MTRSFAEQLSGELRKAANPDKAALLQRFFKTGKGEYGEGDLFLGVTVPWIRKVAKHYKHLRLADIQVLLRSRYHEERLAALILLREKFRKVSAATDREEIVGIYLDNIRYINSWDLVDVSAPNILGAFLQDKDRSLLFNLAKSDNVWARRISIISTFYFIKNGEINDALEISEILLGDKHDLIHKAVGWVLREVCKCDSIRGEAFLKSHLGFMPRMTLRYAIEKFSEKKRLQYLKNNATVKLRSNKMAP